MTRLTRIHQVGAHMADATATRAFYEHTLGAHFLAEFDPPGLLFFEFNGTRLLFEHSTPPATLYFWVDDLDAAFAGLQAAGVTFDAPPHLIHRDTAGTFDNPGSEEWMAFFSDPGGNTLALASRQLSAAR